MKKKLLVVDDNEMLTEFLYEYLSIDYEVIIRNDALEALLDIKEIEPDIILVDHHLGSNITGLDVIKNLKVSRFMLNLPSILITGETNSELRIEALSEGVDDVICKPFNPKELKLRIRKCLTKTLIG